MEIRNIGGGDFNRSQRNSLNSIRKTDKELSKVLNKLSTAKRINSAADDAAGLAVAEQLSSQVRGLKMASNNVAYAGSALNIADGAAQEISEMVQRQRELAVQAKNDTLTDEQRQGLDKEFQQITQEVERVSQATSYNNQTVLNGRELASGSSQIQAGPDQNDAIAMPQVNLTTEALGIKNLSIADQASASNALDALDGALQTINENRSTLGAVSNRMDSAFNNLSVAETNTQAAESVLRDEDMVSGLAEMTRSRLLQDAGYKAFQKFNEISINHIVNLLQ